MTSAAVVASADILLHDLLPRGGGASAEAPRKRPEENGRGPFPPYEWREAEPGRRDESIDLTDEELGDLLAPYVAALPSPTELQAVFSCRLVRSPRASPFFNILSMVKVQV